MPLRKRKRLEITWVAIFCLLFQQVALSAYLCPTDAGRVAMSTHSGACAEMNKAAVADDAGLCVKHCHPDQASGTDATQLSVPPLALPAVMFSPVMGLSASRGRWLDGVAIVRSDPPPRLRYCSLLI